MQAARPIASIGVARPAARLAPLPLGRRRCRRSAACTPTASSSPAADQLSAVASRLSTVRCRELLAASLLELIKASLVGSAPPPTAAPPPAGDAEAGAAAAADDPPGPESLLDELHASLQAALQDAAHTIAPEHQQAYSEAQWETFQAANSAIHGLILELHSQAAAAGSPAGALHAARCLEHGMLVPTDHAAAFARYKEAAQLGSAEGCLRMGIHYFEGTAPGGRDGARAFDLLSQALELAEAAVAGGGGSSNDGSEATALPPLAPPSAETAVEGDLPELLTPEEVRYSALTWLGRCYQEGAGVMRSIAQAAEYYTRAGNEAELGQLAALQQELAGLTIGGGGGSGDGGEQ